WPRPWRRCSPTPTSATGTAMPSGSMPAASPPSRLPADAACDAGEPAAVTDAAPSGSVAVARGCPMAVLGNEDEVGPRPGWLDPVALPLPGRRPQRAIAPVLDFPATDLRRAELVHGGSVGGEALRRAVLEHDAVSGKHLPQAAARRLGPPAHAGREGEKGQDRAHRPWHGSPSLPAAAPQSRTAPTPPQRKCRRMIPRYSRPEMVA